MQLLRIHGPGDVRLDEVPEPPALGPRDALLEIAACGICGSDLGYIKLGGIAGPAPEPTAIGHEFSATVIEVGDEVTRYAPGTRVVMNPIASGNGVGNGAPEGGFAPRVLAREVEGGDVLFPIPDSLPLETAALSEPLGVAMHAVDRADLDEGDRVCVFGAGPIGLMAVAVLAYRGFEEIAVVDFSERRLAIARSLGATIPIDAGKTDVWKELVERHGEAKLLGVIPCAGTNAFIEATGSPTVMAEILQHARPNARISLVALHRQPESIDYMSVMMRELTIRGSMAYPDDYSEMVRMLGDVDLSAAITHRFPLSDYREALDVAADPEVAGKVVLAPQTEG